MQENNVEGASQASFRKFLSGHRIAILIILFLALGFRVVLAVRYSLPAGDENRYTTPAINMLAGRGFSNDVSPPYGPTEHVVPLYPLFIATVYAVFGENNSAVRIAQGLIDLLTCLLVAFIAFRLAPASLARPAAIMSLVIYGCLSWFTVHWTRYVLTETLALFFTTLAIAVSILAIQKKALAVAGCGSYLRAGAFDPSRFSAAGFRFRFVLCLRTLAATISCNGRSASLQFGNCDCARSLDHSELRSLWQGSSRWLRSMVSLAAVSCLRDICGGYAPG